MEWWREAGFLQAVLAAAITWSVLKLLHPLAPRLNLIDMPKGRKDHAHPTPITGGLAMALAFLLVGALSLREHASDTILSFIGAAALLTTVGLFDDRYDLRWYWRIVAQAVAALIMIYGADVRVEQIGPVFGMSDLSLGWLSVPFTVFATIGIINAINMIDGADGLAGLLVAACLAMLASAAIYAGNLGLSRHALMVSGAVGAFLLYNMRFPWQPRAKAFMGNAGSAFLGLVVAWVVFRLTQNDVHPVNPVLALWLIPVPVMDCLVLTVRRWREGRSPFSAGRDHIHHFMQDAGFGPTQAALTLAAFSLCCGLLAAQAMRFDVPHPVLLVAFLLLVIAWYAISANQLRALRVFGWLRRLPLFGRISPRGEVLDRVG
jgi:UDP-GlcNAc:undecaprenyl-phosphate GlcNAc-1-phosphate transferase